LEARKKVSRAELTLPDAADAAARILPGDDAEPIFVTANLGRDATLR
jgi:hypothetical protein